MIKKYTEDELRIIQKYNTPEKVQEFLLNLDYNFEENGETIKSFRRVIKDKTAHCLEGAITAAAILENYGFEPLILDFDSSDKLGHVLYLYLDGKKYGTIGKSRCKRLMGRKPGYKEIEELVYTYYQPFMDRPNARIKSYAIGNLNEVKADWRFSERNLWSVQKYLGELKHTRLETLE